ncbi:hypothetical protein BRUCa_2976 [Brucella melitensis]
MKGLAAHELFGNRLPFKFAVRRLFAKQPSPFLANDTKDAVIIQV